MPRDKVMVDFSETSRDIFASVVGSASCVYTGQPFGTMTTLI